MSFENHDKNSSEFELLPHHFPILKNQYQEKIKILFVQLGSPKSPKVSDVRKFLKEFLIDRRVVDLNPFFWRLILYFFILPFRPRKSARLYSRIWDGKEFPLIKITEKFTQKVKGFLSHPALELHSVYLLSKPRADKIFDDWERDPQGANKICVIPLFPQYSESTTLSGIDQLFKEIEKRSRVPNLSILTHFHRSKVFINSSAQKIDEALAHYFKSNPHVNPDEVTLFLSFHGIQKRRILDKGDDYFQHTFETFYLIREKIQKLSKTKIVLTYQSRFGSEEWLTPYTEETVIEYCQKGEKHILVYSPSFMIDCLETIDELGHELHETAKEHGANLQAIPCLNDDEDWCRDFAQFVTAHTTGSLIERDELFYTPPKKCEDEFLQLAKKELKMKSNPMPAESKKTLKIIFLTIFLDLVGFSIIFPLFPSLTKYYLETDGQNIFLQGIYSLVNSIISSTGGNESIFSAIVLFGGILGALYSLLQFLAAPFWGALSDRIGRKPVLKISLFFLMISYALWFFSGSFTLLIAARFLGGMMAGNISTATAVVSDITDESNRAKGMAVIGIAFALGFVIGPALGGILSLIDLTKLYPSLSEYGVNPFSVPALLAFLLSLWNLVWVQLQFRETLSKDNQKLVKDSHTRSANPLKIFRPLPYVGVNIVNYGHFLFLMAFSGMEFTLTFLAHERLQFTSLQNAYLFIYIGFILVFIQGGVVRRSAHKVGEKKMAIMGLCSLIPGLLIISQAYSQWMLYLGLFFLALGSGMAIPCLTTLVTLYTPKHEQGRSVGIFRSLGALSRVLGPLFAALLYYKFGAAVPYIVGAVFMVLPVILIQRLPKLT